MKEIEILISRKREGERELGGIDRERWREGQGEKERECERERKCERQ